MNVVERFAAARAARVKFHVQTLTKEQKRSLRLQDAVMRCH